MTSNRQHLEDEMRICAYTWGYENKSDEIKESGFIKKLKKSKFYTHPCGKWKDVNELKEIVKELEYENN